MERATKHIRELVGRDQGVVAGLVRENSRRLALDALLTRFLDRPFRDHVQVASAREGRLVLCADSPAWGHRVRYLVPPILEHFQTSGLPDLQEVAIIVRSREPTGDSPPGSPREAARPRLSARSAAVLRQAADAQGDPELARRLRALARHGQP